MGESIHDSLFQVGEVYGVPPPPTIPWRKCETKRVDEEYRADRLCFFFKFLILRVVSGFVDTYFWTFLYREEIG